jgi:hypothetical protein
MKKEEMKKRKRKIIKGGKVIGATSEKEETENKEFKK